MSLICSNADCELRIIMLSKMIQAVAAFRTGDGTHLVKDDRDDTHEQSKPNNRHPGKEQQLITCNCMLKSKLCTGHQPRNAQSKTLRMLRQLC